MAVEFLEAAGWTNYFWWLVAVVALLAILFGARAFLRQSSQQRLEGRRRDLHRRG